MTSPVHRSLSIDDVASLLAASYGIAGDLTRLPGENDNYLVASKDGERFVLKLAGEDRMRVFFELEHQVIERVHAASLGIGLPRTIVTRSGETVSRLRRDDGATFRGRLMEFVSGTAWCDAGPPTPDRLRALGQLLARLDLVLSKVDNPAALRTHSWDLATADQHRGKIALVGDPTKRRILERSFHLYAACAVPRLDGLPHSLIHADANDENILVENGKISGLLDFSDCLVSPTVCELAIAVAYAMFDHPQPLEIGAEIVAGYHAARPLTPAELEVLFPLICGRLSVSVAVAAERRRVAPDHPTWFVTEARAWDLLEHLVAVDPAEATAQLASSIDVIPDVDRGAPNGRLLEARQRHISRALSIAYREPLKMVRGSGQYLYDERGRRFLDLVNNVCHVGHCHPR
ncbi:MAG: phosphotransferase, partial [Candidatus Bipolaricaulia bacterium]